MNQYPANRRARDLWVSHGVTNISLPIWSLVQANRRLRAAAAQPWFWYVNGRGE